MKVRVVMKKNGKFIVQCKRHWWSPWSTRRMLVDPANRCPTYSGPLMKEDIEYDDRLKAEHDAESLLFCSKQTVFIT